MSVNYKQEISKITANFVQKAISSIESKDKPYPSNNIRICILNDTYWDKCPLRDVECDRLDVVNEIVTGMKSDNRLYFDNYEKTFQLRDHSDASKGSKKPSRNRSNNVDSDSGVNANNLLKQALGVQVTTDVICGGRDVKFIPSDDGSCNKKRNNNKQSQGKQCNSNNNNYNQSVENSAQISAISANLTTLQISAPQDDTGDETLFSGGKKKSIQSVLSNLRNKIPTLDEHGNKLPDKNNKTKGAGDAPPPPPPGFTQKTNNSKALNSPPGLIPVPKVGGRKQYSDNNTAASKTLKLGNLDIKVHKVGGVSESQSQKGFSIADAVASSYSRPPHSTTATASGASGNRPSPVVAALNAAQNPVAGRPRLERERERPPRERIERERGPYNKHDDRSQQPQQINAGNNSNNSGAGGDPFRQPLIMRGIIPLGKSPTNAKNTDKVIAKPASGSSGIQYSNVPPTAPLVRSAQQATAIRTRARSSSPIQHSTSRTAVPETGEIAEDDYQSSVNIVAHRYISLAIQTLTVNSPLPYGTTNIARSLVSVFSALPENLMKCDKDQLLQDIVKVMRRDWRLRYDDNYQGGKEVFWFSDSYFAEMAEDDDDNDDNDHVPAAKQTQQSQQQQPNQYQQQATYLAQQKEQQQQQYQHYLQQQSSNSQPLYHSNSQQLQQQSSARGQSPLAVQSPSAQSLMHALSQPQYQPPQRSSSAAASNVSVVPVTGGHVFDAIIGTGSGAAGKKSSATSASTTSAVNYGWE